jgi:dTDP-glucose 4,6-dehydratase
MTYGKPQYLPVDVNHPQVPFGPYGQSKKAAEDICREYRKKGIGITIFRPRMINGPGRLGILKKLFFLIEHNLPVPTIGNGKNCYQMVSVFDCVAATLAAIKCGCPNKEYNLGSKNPLPERELLKTLVKKVGSHSSVIPTPGKLVKVLLGLLGLIGFEIMYKEQYMIADEDYILDISETEKDLMWSPQYSDQDMIIQAYQEYQAYTHR